MVGTNTKTNTLEVRRTIQAPVEKVYRAWTEPEQISQWFGCDKVARARVTQELKVGGQYRIEANCADGSPGLVYGTFKEIIPNQKLVYSWTNGSAEYPASDTIVSVEFIARGSETEIHLVHSNFALAKSVEGHTMGWQECLEKLARFVA
ncbi:MAG: hypothetical protein C5B53_08830 [Candidatus Melainabacteria bacterium]|nr:MAG: hypothetical protein C5B53_08830 [Candidatus Melainabacteria bacterium]